MRFALTADHREFFVKNNYIAFEEVISLEQIALLKKNAEEVLERRLHTPLKKLADTPANTLFQAGYDLWRGDETIKKIVHKQTLASIASELFQTLPLRYGFDQYFWITQAGPAPFSEAQTLQETSCLSPLAGALILPLSDQSEPLPFFPLPITAGSCLFISPSLPIPWGELFSTPGLCFLLIAFAKEKTLFLADSPDPHAVNLKKLGYVFNESLNNTHHPILLRKSNFR